MELLIRVYLFDYLVSYFIIENEVILQTTPLVRSSNVIKVFKIDFNPIKDEESILCNNCHEERIRNEAIKAIKRPAKN